MLQVWPQVVLALALSQFDQRFALTWDVPCAPMPDTAALLGAAEGEAVVTIRPVDAQWHLEVRFVAPASGIRKLDAPTCEDAAMAALLFLKLGATGQPDRAPVTLKPPEPEPPPLPRAPLNRELRVELSGGFNAGALPSATPRLAASLGLGAGPWAGFLTLRAGLTSSYPGPAGTRFAVHPLIGARLSGCYLARLGRLRVGPCVGAGVEAWQATGLNVDLPRGALEAWAEAGADLRMQFTIFRSAYLFALGGPRFSLRRPQLVFEGFGEAFTVPIVSGEAAIGVGFQW